MISLGFITKWSSGGRGASCPQVVVAEILAARWQLMVVELRQVLLKLEEEPLAWLVAIGVHVEGCAQLGVERREELQVGGLEQGG